MKIDPILNSNDISHWQPLPIYSIRYDYVLLNPRNYTFMSIGARDLLENEEAWNYCWCTMPPWKQTETTSTQLQEEEYRNDRQLDISLPSTHSISHTLHSSQQSQLPTRLLQG